MICGKCKTRDVTVDHTRACYAGLNTVTVTAPDFEPVPMTDGMYRDPNTAVIYKVQRSQQGRLYAKILVLAEDPEKNSRFEYAPGAIRDLRGEWKMTLPQAKMYGALYGTCIRCGSTLTDERSIEAGIGPVCAGKGTWA